MRELSGKVAVVTGGASGIGRALAEAFAAEGMKVALADVEEAALEGTVKALEGSGASVRGFVTDVSDPEDVRSLAEETLAAFGAVHVVCNNAGVAPVGSILQTSLSDWRWLLDVNLMGVVHGIATFGPILVERGEGHIVNTASAAGLMAPPGLGAYAATKHAVVGLSETLYYELDGTGVGVSILCPALVNTRIFESERNRPAALGGRGAQTALHEVARKLLQGMGMPPARIAECVVDAIRQDRLFVLPHEEIKPLVRERAQLISEGRNPPRDRNVGLPRTE